MGHWGVVGLVAAASSSLVGLSPADARACSPSWPVPVPNTVSMLTDHTPPVIADVTVDLMRGKYDRMNSCSDLARLWLDVVATDDQTANGKFRFLVQDVGGDEPFFYYDEPVPYFFLVWSERDASEPVDLRLRIFALDEAGNQSEPFDITIQDGVEDEGCNIAPSPRGAAPAWSWLLGALATLLRRRWRAGPPE
jgi:hypothetical protein